MLDTSCVETPYGPDRFRPDGVGQRNQAADVIIGADNDNVFKDLLGLNGAQIAQLADEGII